MISLLPSTSPQDTHAAYAIIALVADPEAAKKRLDELVAEKTELEQIRSKAEDLAKQSSEARAAVTQASKEHARSVQETDARHKKTAAELSDLHARLLDTQRGIEKRESEVAKREEDAERIAVSLTAREKRAKDAETLLEKRAAKLAAGESDYAGRMSQLKKLAG